MAGPGPALHMLTVDENLLTQSIGDQRREIHYFDAIPLSGGEAAAVSRRYGIATDFGMTRNVEQGVDAAADALATLRVPAL